MSGCNLMPSKEGDGTINDSAKTEGAAVGAGAMGFLAALGTYAVTGDAKKALAAGFIGAAIGGAAGYLYGREVYKDQKKFASTEAFLDHHVTTAVKNNKNISSSNQKLETQLAELDKEVNALKARYQAGKATREDLQTKHHKITTRLADEQKNNKELQARIGNQRKAIKVANAKQTSLAKNETVKLAKLEKENQRFKKSVDQHSQLVEQLQAMSTSDALDI
jgi:outer membrane murein-binding lipoprotein Lpp